MKIKLYQLLCICLLVFLTISCSEDDDTSNQTAIASFGYTEPLVELESATQALMIDIGFDSARHASGTIEVTISGAEYGAIYETSENASTFILEINENDLLKTFSISPIDNDVINEDIELTITLTNATGGIEIGEENTINLSILDDEDPLVATVNFENTQLSLDENSENSLMVNIPFNQSSTNGGVLSISVSGDAILGDDYTIAGQTEANFSLTVEPGAASAAIEIIPIDNNEFAANKTISLSIADVSGGLEIGEDSETNITLVNDDEAQIPYIDFSTAASTYSENDGTLTVELVLTQAAQTQSTANITISGDAILGQDFTVDGTSNNPYQLTIPVGVTQVTLPIELIDNSEISTDKSILLELTSATNPVELGVNQLQHNITIEDDDFTPLNYVEDFEAYDGSADYLTTTLNYENILINQTLAANQIIDVIENTGNFADLSDVTQSSDHGLNIFYNSSNTGNPEGILDNAVITPQFQTIGQVNLSVDMAYAFKNQNNATVTVYYSESYNGSGTFNESDWTVLGTETVSNMDSEGFGNNAYKRKLMSWNASAPFYIAIRVNQTIDSNFYRTRWRFDNIQLENQ